MAVERCGNSCSPTKVECKADPRSTGCVRPKKWSPPLFEAVLKTVGKSRDRAPASISTPSDLSPCKTRPALLSWVTNARGNFGGWKNSGGNWKPGARLGQYSLIARNLHARGLRHRTSIFFTSIRAMPVCSVLLVPTHTLPSADRTFGSKPLIGTSTADHGPSSTRRTIGR
jgi:hypothetical protein